MNTGYLSLILVLLAVGSGSYPADTDDYVNENDDLSSNVKDETEVTGNDSNNNNSSYDSSNNPSTSLDSECIDEYPSQYCEEVVQEGKCNLDKKAWHCRQSCQLCTKSMEPLSSEERSEKCKDLVPQCDVYANPMICCGMKPVANVTCQEACKFCTNIPMPQIPGSGFMPGGGSQQAPVVYTDPCDPSKPPSSSAGGVPGVPG